MITALIAVMCVWTVCLIVAFTMTVCDKDDWSVKWFISSSFCMYLAIWVVVVFTTSDSNQAKQKHVEVEAPK